MPELEPSWGQNENSDLWGAQGSEDRFFHSSDLLIVNGLDQSHRTGQSSRLIKSLGLVHYDSEPALDVVSSA